MALSFYSRLKNSILAFIFRTQVTELNDIFIKYFRKEKLQCFCIGWGCS